MKEDEVGPFDFEGLASFEEIKSIKLIKEVQYYGEKRLEYEIIQDGKITKKRKKKKQMKFLPVESEIFLKPSIRRENGLKRKDLFKEGLNNSEKKNKIAIDEYSWKSIFTPEEVIEAIKDLGFHHPTEIQKLTIPAAINKRRDIIGAAETGSGKTLAFGIPVISGILKIKEREAINSMNTQVDNSENKFNSKFEKEIIGHVDLELDDKNNINEEIIDLKEGLGCVKVIDNANFDFVTSPGRKSIKSTMKNNLYALIITPTRELAVQIKKHLDAILIKTTIKTAIIIGGLSHAKQERLLDEQPEIVIGTPGRLWEMIEQDNEHLSNVSSIRYLVIDETDHMFEKGHFEELKQLLELVNADSAAKKKRQTFIFSATLTMTVAPPKRLNSKKVHDITREMKLENLVNLIGIRDKPKIVDITRKAGTAETLFEAKINCLQDEKDIYLYYFIKKFPGRTLVFCNSVNCVKRLSNLLNILQCKPQALHASKQQKQRLKHLEYFTSNHQSVLLATDVASRGIDIPGVDHIIHYEIPCTAETYIHRSGRTARANQEGISVLLINSDKMGKYRELCTNLSRTSDLPSLPIEGDIFRRIRERVLLAQAIEKAEYGMKKKQTDQSWFEQMAEEAGLIWENDKGDDDDVAEEAFSKKQTSREILNYKEQLKQLLNQPIMPANFSARYLASSGIFSMHNNLVTGGTTDKSTAIELLKSRKKGKKPLETKAPSLRNKKKKSNRIRAKKV